MTQDSTNDIINVDNALNTLYSEDHKMTGSYDSIGFNNLVIIERYIKMLEQKYADLLLELYEDHEDTENTE